MACSAKRWGGDFARSPLPLLRLRVVKLIWAIVTTGICFPSQIFVMSFLTRCYVINKNCKIGGEGRTSTTIQLSKVILSAAHNHHKRQTNAKNADLHFCSVEASLQESKGYQYVLGSDEAGRGAIAGPIVAATCCLLVPNISKAIASGSFCPVEDVKDSKQLTYEECLTIYSSIKDLPNEYAWQICVVDANEIDNTNVQVSNMKALRGSIEKLVDGYNLQPERLYCIVDGKKSPKLSPQLNGVLRTRPWVRADAEVYTVALASIIAKVCHNKIMLEQAHKEFPQYHFDENGGYPSKAHLQYMHEHGPCHWHRQSAKPVYQRNALPQSNTFGN